MGVNKQLSNRMRAFLRNRIQKEIIVGTKSDSCHVSSKVTHGSVIGPDRFLIFINDLLVTVRLKVCLFADDTVIYKSAKILSMTKTGHVEARGVGADLGNILSNLKPSGLVGNQKTPNRRPTTSTKIKSQKYIIPSTM